MNKKGIVIITAIATAFSLNACDFFPDITPESPDHPVITDIVVKEPKETIEDVVGVIDTDTETENQVGDDGEGKEGTEDYGQESGLYYYPKDAESSIYLSNEVHGVDELIEVSKAYFDYIEAEAAANDAACGFEDSLERVAFRFVDLNGDDLKELAYTFDSSHASGIRLATYDMEKGEVVPLGIMGQYGSTVVYIGKNMVLNYYSGMGYTYSSFVTFDEDNSQRILVEFNDDAGMVDDADDATYKINGIEVSQEEYDAVYEQWRTYYSMMYFSIAYEQMIPYYDGDVDFEMLSYSYDVEDDVLKKAYESYKDILIQLGCPAFSFTYINGDNVPELVIAEGNGPENGVTVFQYVSYLDQVICYGQFGMFGTMNYVDGTGLLLHSTTLGGNHFFLINDYMVIPINSFDDTEVWFGEDGANDYIMDGMYVEKDIYKKYRKAWEEIDYMEISYDMMITDYSEDEILALFEKVK